jgi:Sec-independent protein translocase protein TatA
MPIKKVENRYTLPGVKWSPLLQSDQAIARLKREIRESKKALRGLTDPIYREAEQAFLRESEASLKRHREKRQKLDARLQKEQERLAQRSA